MAVYKHKGISNGSMQFEWLSSDADPQASNPYPTGYEGLTFETIEASAIEAAEFLSRDSREARAYLNKTDWYIIRELDSGVPCPDDVRQKRAEARLKI